MKVTDIRVVMDRSGSMSTTKDDAIGGFNSFVEGQKKTPGEATLTLALFDDYYDVVYKAKPIAYVEPLNSTTFVPSGSTALVDAIGRTISQFNSDIAALPPASQPNGVFLIITDGGENASREFTSIQVHKMIDELKEKGHQVVFIGANQDAIKTSAAFGISAGNSMTYAANGVGTTAAFGALSKNVSLYRSGGKADMSFDASDYMAQAAAGVK